MALPRNPTELRAFLFGRPLTTDEQEHEQVGVFAGVPVLGLDALASASYGPEALLTVFVLAGATGLDQLLAIVGCIIGILLIVQFSYRQTIATHPQGGGSYTVAKENLGTRAGLVAASALFLDYVLNVAVAISAGVGALVSAIPSLHGHTLALCLGLLAFLTLVNLRGIRTTGMLFAFPTFAFVALLGGTIVLGLWRVTQGGIAPAPESAAPLVASVGPWLVLRAFASGCTAMTGIEAVSNAVPVFHEPRIRTAQRTLATIVVILVCLLAGTALLARALDITATMPGQPGYESLLSQVVRAVDGTGVLYFATMASIMAVLCLSANTSFADFPRLCRVLALDEFLPEAFAHQGRRLVYSTGILLLSFGAALLLIVFRGVTDHLIPLFAIGALLAFTMSQAGMVGYWRRRPGHGHSLAINAVGAIVTGLTAFVVAVAKFEHGAWISIGIIGTTFSVFVWMKGRFAAERRETSARGPVEFRPEPPPIVVLPIRRLDHVARKGLHFAVSLSPDVYAVQVRAPSLTVDDEVFRHWKALVEAPARQAGLEPPRLRVLTSKYRDVVDPLLAFVRLLARENHERRIMVLVPELVVRRWYHYLLHSHTATVIRLMLLFRGGPQVVLVNVPWYVRADAHRRATRHPREQADRPPAFRTLLRRRARRVRGRGLPGGSPSAPVDSLRSGSE